MKRWLRMGLLLVLLLNASNSFSGQVIVHAAVEEQGISRSALLAAFSMRTRRWPDGSPMKVIVLPDDHPVHLEFVKNSLQIFPYQLRAVWDRILYSGAGHIPEIVTSIQQMQDLVASTPGAIGYIGVAAQGGGNGVKVLDVR